MLPSKIKIEKRISIKAPLAKVWDIITNPKFAKILGNELDENAYLESDWQLGSEVYFKYEPDKLIATGIITKFKLHELIKVDYKEINYADKYSLHKKSGAAVLTINAGPYPDDYHAQLKAWNNWLLKVKQLCEK